MSQSAMPWEKMSKRQRSLRVLTAREQGEFRWFCPYPECTSRDYKGTGAKQKRGVATHIARSGSAHDDTENEKPAPILRCTWSSCKMNHGNNETEEDLVTLHMEQKEGLRDEGVRKRS